MPASTNDIRQRLLANNPEFRQLEEEHHRCESELEHLVMQSYWKQEDLEHEVMLKKTKLHIKDRMQFIIARQFSRLQH